MKNEQGVQFYLSTEHADWRDNDNGIFKFTIGNSVKIPKSVSLIPLSMTLPNIFPNVNKYRNYLWEGTPGNLKSYEWTVPEGQYSFTDLVSSFNNLLVFPAMTVTTGGRVQLAQSDHDIVTLSSDTRDIFDVLGFSDQVTISDGLFVLEIPNTDTNPPVVASNPPNIGGEKIVFVICDHMGQSNMIHGSDGLPYDVVGHIPLHSVDYGQEAHWRAVSSEIDGIDFKEHKDLTTLTFELKDSKNRSLPLPPNYHLRMLFKVFHRDAGKS